MLSENEVDNGQRSQAEQITSGEGSGNKCRLIVIDHIHEDAPET